VRFESFIARRYLSTRRKPPFVSLILAISLISVTSGVFALIFVLSIMNGFEKDFRSRILSFQAPVTIVGELGEDMAPKAAEILTDSRIERIVPFAEGEAVAQTREGGVLGLRVRGIGEAPTESRLGRYYEGDPFDQRSAVMGEELAAGLGVNASFAEPIKLIYPLGDVGPTGELLPRVKEFEVTGIFHSGFYDYDSKYALVSYERALSLFGDQARTGLEVWLKRPGEAEYVAAKLKLAGWKVKSWKDQNPKLFSAMKFEKIGMFLLLGMLVLIAAFNVFGLVSLTVLDKKADMAVLRSVGVKTSQVRRIFLMKAALIGLFGSVVGGGFGAVSLWLLIKYPMPLPTSYYLETLPIAVDASDIACILALVPVVTILAALYPARQSTRTGIVEALRSE